MDGSPLRPDTPITQQRLDELSAVRGFIQEVFVHEDPVTGKRHRLISAEDGERIAQGYACGECGAIYDMVMPRCVACGQPIGLNLAPMRPEWEQHLADRADGYTAPIAQNPLSPDEFIRSVRADRDIEQRKL
jgi:hypothetical protein